MEEGEWADCLSNFFFPPVSEVGETTLSGDGEK